VELEARATNAVFVRSNAAATFCARQPAEICAESAMRAGVAPIDALSQKFDPFFHILPHADSAGLARRLTWLALTRTKRCKWALWRVCANRHCART